MPHPPCMQVVASSPLAPTLTETNPLSCLRELHRDSQPGACQASCVVPAELPFARGSLVPDPVPVPAGASAMVPYIVTDTLARARTAAAQSRGAAPVLCEPRPPPKAPRTSPFRNDHFRSSECPRRRFRTIHGLMRHTTHEHVNSPVDEATRALFAEIERVTCADVTCGGWRRVGARTCNRCDQPTPAQSFASGSIIFGSWSVSQIDLDHMHMDTAEDRSPPLATHLPVLTLPECALTPASLHAARRVLEQQELSHAQVEAEWDV